MNIVRLSVGAAVFLGAITSLVSAETFTVKKVIDGDTLQLSNGKTVQLIGIDAPENVANQKAKMFAKNSGKKVKDVIALGERSAKFTKGLTEGKEVRLEYDVVTESKSGELYAYVYEVSTYRGNKSVTAPEGVELANGNEVFLNATILKSGYATPLGVPPNVKYVQLFKELSLDAIKNKRGLWK